MKSNNVNRYMLVITISSSLICPTAVAEQKKTPEDQLAATVRRYFEGSRSYQPGDIITQSQLAEMQMYLRRTAGYISAANPRLMKRALPDQSRLIQYFYAGNNSKLLRVVAQKSGGYAGLDKLCQNTAGRNKLDSFLKTGNYQTLMQALRELPQKKSVKRLPPIYTVADFLVAVRKPAIESKTPVPGKEDPPTKLEPSK